MLRSESIGQVRPSRRRLRPPARRRRRALPIRPRTASPRRRRRLPEPRREKDAFATALRALNRRERSTAEIAGWLEARGFDAAAIADAIERLSAAGTLDDERFARCFAADKRELDGWGEERIAATLIARGVDRELAEQTSSEEYSEQTERAARLLAQRAQPLDNDGARSRALGFLTRRGFSYEVAYDAIRAADRDAA